MDSILKELHQRKKRLEKELKVTEASIDAYICMMDRIDRHSTNVVNKYKEIFVDKVFETEPFSILEVKTLYSRMNILKVLRKIEGVNEELLEVVDVSDVMRLSKSDLQILKEKDFPTPLRDTYNNEKKLINNKELMVKLVFYINKKSKTKLKCSIVITDEFGDIKLGKFDNRYVLRG